MRTSIATAYSLFKQLISRLRDASAGQSVTRYSRGDGGSFPLRIFLASFRGAGEAREPGIHTHGPWLWIPALAAVAARPE